MNKIYLIIYRSNNEYEKLMFHNHINRLYPTQISDWWHYMDNFYLIATNLGVNSLYSSVFPGIPGKHILIMKVDPNDSQGWLPKNAWDWIQKYQSKQ